jgi:transposase
MDKYMSTKNRFIKDLTDEQRSQLNKGYKNGRTHTERRKCQAILLSADGKTVNEICFLIGVTKLSVYNWFNAWESSGIAGMTLKPGRGPKTKLDPNDSAQVNLIKELVENEPQNLRKVVSQIQTKTGIALSKWTLIRHLKKSSPITGSDSVKA